MFYEFKCTKCEIVFDREYPMAKAPARSKCPQCKKLSERYYGNCNFILKGGGWPSKNIRRGAPAIAENVFEAEDANRKKKGLKPSKEVPMSDEEFNKRKKKNLEWIESVKKK